MLVGLVVPDLLGGVLLCYPQRLICGNFDIGLNARSFPVRLGDWAHGPREGYAYHEVIINPMAGNGMRSTLTLRSGSNFPAGPVMGLLRGDALAV